MYTVCPGHGSLPGHVPATARATLIVLLSNGGVICGSATESLPSTPWPGLSSPCKLATLIYLLDPNISILVCQFTTSPIGSPRF